MSLTNEQIIEAIGQKTVLEVVELIKAMEETFTWSYVKGR